MIARFVEYRSLSTFDLYNNNNNPRYLLDYIDGINCMNELDKDGNFCDFNKNFLCNYYEIN